MSVQRACQHCGYRADTPRTGWRMPTSRGTPARDSGGVPRRRGVAPPWSRRQFGATANTRASGTSTARASHTSRTGAAAVRAETRTPTPSGQRARRRSSGDGRRTRTPPSSASTSPGCGTPAWASARSRSWPVRPAATSAPSSRRATRSRACERERQQRILAISPQDFRNRAPHSRMDPTGTRRRLQALVAIGYPFAELASRLGRTTGNLGRCLVSESVNAYTALDVAELYERLSLVVPRFATDHEREASERARAQAQERGWLPPLAWDDIDHDAEPEAGGHPPGDDIDEIAVERALAGDGIRLEHLNWAEQAEVVRLLTERGKSIRDIADLLATTARTVSRRRRRVRAA